MFVLFHLLAVLCLFGSAFTAELQSINGIIKISVVTTSGCGDTVSFISNQLVPAYQQYGKFLQIEFIPWGRTTRDLEGNKICQFGAADCWANRLHRCALNLLKNDQDAQVNYMACEFSSPFPAYLQGSYQCALAAGLNTEALDSCVNPSASPLDDAAEIAAAEPMAIINFVPAIVFNNDIQVSLHQAARTRLSEMICAALANDPTTNITNC